MNNENINNSTQVEALKKIINHTSSLNGLVKELEYITQTGQTHYSKIKFNGDVREAIRNIL